MKKILILLMIVLVGCASEPEKIVFAEKSCLESFALFLDQKSEGYIKGPITVGRDFVYTWVTDTRTDIDEYIYITKNATNKRYGTPTGVCQNTDKVLKIYMIKEKRQH